MSQRLEVVDPKTPPPVWAALRNEAYAAAQMAEELAGALFQLGRHGEALPELDTSIAYYRTAGMHPYLARSLRLRARLLDATSRAAEAVEARAEAVQVEAAIAERNTAQTMEKA